MLVNAKFLLDEECVPIVTFIKNYIKDALDGSINGFSESKTWDMLEKKHFYYSCLFPNIDQQIETI